MSRGGARPGAGRPKGSKTVDSRMIREAVQSGADITGSSLEYLQKVYRGKVKDPDPRRIEAARAAAPYEFARLTDATVTHRTEADLALDGKSPEEVNQWLIEQMNNILLTPGLRALLTEWAKQALGLVEKPQDTPTVDSSGNVVPISRAAAQQTTH